MSSAYGNIPWHPDPKAQHGYFAYCLAKYLGSKDSSSMSAVEINYVKALFCPGYGKFSTEDTNVAQTRVTYRLTVGYTNGLAQVPNTAIPFGYQGSMGRPRLRNSQR
ncbi:MAG: hypothetical protein JWR19_4035 [Pedosphaera sp.]|nr:hypothetical protein [Pedosphaera sp.]